MTLARAHRPIYHGGFPASTGQHHGRLNSQEGRRPIFINKNGFGTHV